MRRDCAGRGVQSRAGQGLLEYGIILGLIALGTTLALVCFGNPIGAAVTWLGSLLP